MIITGNEPVHIHVETAQNTAKFWLGPVVLASSRGYSSGELRRLQALVRGRPVTLRLHGQDRYGRLLAEAYVDGRRIEQADIGPQRYRRR